MKVLVVLALAVFTGEWDTRIFQIISDIYRAEVQQHNTFHQSTKFI